MKLKKQVIKRSMIILTDCAKIKEKKKWDMKLPKLSGMNIVEIFLCTPSVFYKYTLTKIQQL